MAAEGALVYLFYVHDTGITFTGNIFADIMLMIAGIVGSWLFGKQLWILRRATLLAIKSIRNQNEKHSKD